MKTLILLLSFTSLLSLKHEVTQITLQPFECGYGYAINDSNTPAAVEITGFFRAPDTQHGKRSEDRTWVYRVFQSYNSALVDRNTYIRSYKSKGTEVNQVEQFEDMCE